MGAIARSGRRRGRLRRAAPRSPAPPARAGLFDDDEARRAILDLRKQLEQSNEQARARQAEQMAQMSAQIDQLKRSLLDLNGNIEALRADNAQAARPDEAARARRRRAAAQADRPAAGRRRAHAQGRAAEGDASTARSSSPTPTKSAATKRRWRSSARGEFDRAATGFGGLLKRYPDSGYRQSALFWLGNAQYAQRDYKEAIATFRSLVASAPDSPRAPEAMLADRQLPGRAEGQQGRAQDDRRAAQGLSEVGSRAGRTRAAGGAAMTPATAGVASHLRCGDDDADLERRFGGLRRLYGDAGYARVRAAHVAVVGLGGVGSWAAEALARSGVGALTLIDLDHVAESNVNRQVQALGSTLGQAKVAGAARAHRRHPSGLRGALRRGIRRRGQLARRCSLGAGRCRHRCLRPGARQGGARRLGAARRARRSSASARPAASGAAERVEVDDLADVTHDPLLAALRQRLRKHHGAPRTGAHRRRCVFSREPVRAAGEASACDVDGSLNCHGYGSSVAVTATFGMVAAARCAGARRRLAAASGRPTRRL